MLTDYDLMTIQATVLYQHNQDGDLTQVNEPVAVPAPKFFLGHTRMGDIYRFHESMGEQARTALRSVLTQPQSHINPAELVQALGEPVWDLYLGPAYVFADGFGMASGAVPIDAQNKECLRETFPDLYAQWSRGPICVVMKDGVAVSACYSARQTAKAAEAGVETLKSWQGFGFGVQATAAWAMAVQARERIALYSTSWDNLSSQAVAKKLKLRLYGMDFHLN